MQTQVLSLAPNRIEADAATRAYADDRALARFHGLLVGVALLLATVAGLLMRIEWMTPPLDLMSARTFGSLLTLHGALAFYFVLIPCGFFIPTILAQANGAAQRVVPLPRLGRLSWMLQAAGLVVLMIGAISGGSEAGWGLTNMRSGRFALPGAGWVAIAGLLSGLAMVAHGVRVWVAAAGAPSVGPSAFVRRVVSQTASAMGLLTGAVLVLCMTLACLVRWGGMPLFDPATGGHPPLYENLFAAFQHAAQSLCWFTPHGLLLATWASEAAVPPPRRLLVPLLGLALFAVVPMWGIFTAWRAISALAAVLGLGALGLRMAARAPSLRAAHLLHGLFWVAMVQALTAQLLLAVPSGISMFSATTFDSAILHLAAYAVIGLALPACMIAAPSDRSIPNGFALALGGLVVFVGMQLALLPDALAGLQGLSFRANAYPAEWQVLKVLAGAGTTIILAGGAIIGGVLFFSRKAAASRCKKD